MTSSTLPQTRVSHQELDSWCYCTVNMEIGGLGRLVSMFVEDDFADPAAALTGAAQQEFALLRNTLDDICDLAGVLGYDLLAPHADCQYHNTSATDRVARIVAAYGAMEVIEDNSNAELIDRKGQPLNVWLDQVESDVLSALAEIGKAPGETLPPESEAIPEPPQRLAFELMRLLLVQTLPLVAGVRASMIEHNEGNARMRCAEAVAAVKAFKH